MRKKSIYSCSIKSSCFRIPGTLGKHFLPPVGCGSIFPAKSCWDACSSNSQLTRSQVNMADEAKRHCPIGSTLKHWLCDMRLVVVMEKNRALSVDQCWLQALQFLVYLFNLLSILLRCNGFARIQKAVENQMGTRPPATLTFFGASSALGSALELLLGPTAKLVVTSYIKYTFCHTSQSDDEMVCCCCIE